MYSPCPLGPFGSINQILIIYKEQKFVVLGRDVVSNLPGHIASFPLVAVLPHWNEIKQEIPTPSFYSDFGLTYRCAFRKWWPPNRTPRLPVLSMGLYNTRSTTQGADALITLLPRWLNKEYNDRPTQSRNAGVPLPDFKESDGIGVDERNRVRFMFAQIPSDFSFPLPVRSDTNFVMFIP